MFNSRNITEVLPPVIQYFSSYIPIWSLLSLASTCSTFKKYIYSIPLNVKCSSTKNLNTKLNITTLTSKTKERELFIPFLAKLKFLSLNTSSKCWLNNDDLVKYPNLLELQLTHNNPFEQIANFSNLTTLMLNKLDVESNFPFYQLPKLKILKIENYDNVSHRTIDNCPNLEEVSLLDIGIVTGPEFTGCPSLRRLFFFGCAKMVSFNCPASVQELIILRSFNFATLTGGEGLTKLEVDKTILPNLSAIKTKQLQELDIDSDNFDATSLLNHRTLTSLKLESLNTESLDLTFLTALKRLVIFTKNMVKLPSQLDTLSVINCNRKDTFDLQQINTNLTSLSIFEVKIVNEVQLLDCTKLKKLNIGHGDKCLPYLRNCTDLEDLKLTFSMESSLDSIERCYNLKKINLKHGNFTNLDGLYNLIWVTRIDLSFCLILEDIEPLVSLPYLKEIILINCSSLLSVSSLSRCPKLKSLTLDACGKVTDISELKCPFLIEFSADACFIPNLDFVQFSPYLQTLDVYNATGLEDISPVSCLRYLSYLDISSTTVKDISPLFNCSSLEHLEMSDVKIAELKVLINCPLNYLNIEKCTCLLDLKFFVENAPYSLTEIRYDSELKLPPRIKRSKMYPSDY
jgi:hypothetical protein